MLGCQKLHSNAIATELLHFLPPTAMSLYSRVLSKFPSNILFSFAYGSGVKKQLGYDTEQKKSSMVDLMFCVRNPEQWHSENLLKNPNHYSSMKYLGSEYITKFQESWGANVYCNTLIPLKDEGIYIKYGVNSEADLLADLLEWRWLYTAGRLHKPVETIIEAPAEPIKSALKHNLQNALRSALLVLPEKFNRFELFYTISGLSYRGDFRMIFGENKNKVRNIVTPQLDKFSELYWRSIEQFAGNIQPIGDEDFRQDKSTGAVEKLMLALPRNLIRRVVRNSRLKEGTTEEIVKEVASRSDYARIVQQSVDQIVWRSSVWQSIKNIPTAGLVKSLSYSWDKAMKTFTTR